MLPKRLSMLLTSLIFLCFFSDQLRQRTAWSLSQMLVVVPDNIDKNDVTEQFVSFYDIFVRNAFG